MKQPSQFLREAAATFEDRNAEYGNNYLDVGNILAGLFPDGLTLKTPDDWLRIHIVMLQAIKMSRYAHNFAKDGHADSMRDLAVYAAMIEAIDFDIGVRREAEALQAAGADALHLSDKRAVARHAMASPGYADGPGGSETTGRTVCDCAVGMCTHRKDCRQTSQQNIFVASEPTFIPCPKCATRAE